MMEFSYGIIIYVVITGIIMLFRPINYLYLLGSIFGIMLAELTIFLIEKHIRSSQLNGKKEVLKNGKIRRYI